MPELHIVQPDHEDVAGLITLVNQGWRDAHINPALGIDEQYLQESATRELSPEGVAKWHRRVDDSVDSDSHFLKIARLGDDPAPVGMIDARNFGDHGALMSLYVTPEWRNGGSNGLAQQLASAALHWIGSMPSDVLIADYNHRSQGFCQRNGYIIPSERRMIGRIPAQLWLRFPQEDI